MQELLLAGRHQKIPFLEGEPVSMTVTLFCTIGFWVKCVDALALVVGKTLTLVMGWPMLMGLKIKGTRGVEGKERGGGEYMYMGVGDSILQGTSLW